MVPARQHSRFDKMEEFDDDFDDDGFDESTMRQLVEIESNLLSNVSTRSTSASARQPSKPVLSSAIRGGAQYDGENEPGRFSDVTSYDMSGDWDDDELIKQVVAAEEQHLKATQARTVPTAATPTATETATAKSKAPLTFAPVFKSSDPQRRAVARDGTSAVSAGAPPVREVVTRAPRTSQFAPVAGSSRQMTLFGEVLPPQGSQGILIQANKANSAIGPSSQQARHAIASILAPSQPSQRSKTKQWDFTQPILRPKRSTIKDDPEGSDEFDDEDLDAILDDADAFDMPPPPLLPPGTEVESLKQMKVKIDREAAKTWIYPTNKEKRDYQFNIVQRALFNNVLVALPTGLGKTFIAAVVILNYFRWFPDGKIIFVAPSKPLVAQQQCACHGICGLPWDTAIEMTGETKASLRAEEWKSKRIFYMTPQTFENDLCSEAVDAQDVVCVVVDEAHRATGNYAYGKVIRHLMVRNPFFRVLALTATPGTNSDKVQEVVDSLHINLIEIRQEDALDIRKYIHTKDEDPVVVPLRGIVGELRDLLSKLMRPSMDVLIGAGVLMNKDPVSLSPFGVRSIYKDPRKKSIVSQRKLFNHISDLAANAQAMQNLIKYSVSMFASVMWSLETGVDATGSKASTKRQTAKYGGNTIVQEMRKRYEACQDQEGLVPHPKMEYLQNVIAAHFANAESSDDPDMQSTRVMVFCSLRECVTEIVALLNRVPSVRATQFVGQSTDKKGNRGLRQKDQERIVSDFKKGDLNVLVSTSIGEEGLDIGEVDLIVCYEAVKDAVRMLQRIGRTGRKREGRIVVLMAEGPEEKNWQQSKDQYKSIQHDIIKGINLSLYDDVERLVPADITSEVLLQDVDQPPFEPTMIRNQTAAAKKRATAAEKKRKRDTNPMRNIPDGALTGFIKVSKMRKTKGQAPARGSAKGKGKERAVCEREGDDDSDDSDDGIFNVPGSSARGREIDILEDDMASDEADAVLERGIIWEEAAKPQQEPADAALSSASSRSSEARPRGRKLGTRRVITAASTITIDTSPASALNDIAGRPASVDRLSSQMTSSSSPVIFRRRADPHPLIAKLAAERSESDSESEDGKRSHVSKAVGKTSFTEPRRKRTFVRRVEALSPDRAGPSAMGPPAFPAVGNGETQKARRAKKSEQSRPKKRSMGGSPTSRRLFQMEADRSTDEEVHGERDEHDEGDSRYEEDSSDREHVGDFAPTQAPKGYKQRAVYLQSLNSDTAPALFQRHGQPSAMRIVGVQQSPRVRTSSTDGGQDDSGNEYEVGSFVCSDNDVELDSSAEPSQTVDLSQQ